MANAKFRIIGTVGNQERSMPARAQWEAIQEAKAAIKRGWEDVEVEVWNKGSNDFDTDQEAHNKLYKKSEDQPKSSTLPSEDVITAAQSVKTVSSSLYTHLKSGKHTDDEINTAANEMISLLRNLGFSSDQIYTMSENMAASQEEVSV